MKPKILTPPQINETEPSPSHQPPNTPQRENAAFDSLLESGSDTEPETKTFDLSSFFNGQSTSEKNEEVKNNELDIETNKENTDNNDSKHETPNLKKRNHQANSK